MKGTPLPGCPSSLHSESLLSLTGHKRQGIPPERRIPCDFCSLNNERKGNRRHQLWYRLSGISNDGAEDDHR